MLDDPDVLAAMERTDGGSFRFLPVSAGRSGSDYLASPDQMDALEPHPVHIPGEPQAHPLLHLHRGRAADYGTFVHYVLEHTLREAQEAGISLDDAEEGARPGPLNFLIGHVPLAVHQGRAGGDVEHPGGNGLEPAGGGRGPWQLG